MIEPEKVMVTVEDFAPLAYEIISVVKNRYPKIPTPREFGIIIGALQATKDSFTGMMNEMGIFSQETIQGNMQ